MNIIELIEKEKDAVTTFSNECDWKDDLDLDAFDEDEDAIYEACLGLADKYRNMMFDVLSNKKAEIFLKIESWLKSQKWIDDEQVKIIMENAHTGGSASDTIFYTLGCECELTTDYDTVDYSLTLPEEPLSSLDEDDIKTINSAFRGMCAAHIRHNDTNYDSINKAGMTDSEVSEIRKLHTGRISNDVQLIKVGE